jgi:hypothetical protein
MKSFKPNYNCVDFISNSDFTNTHHVSPECSTRLRPHAFRISCLVMIWEPVLRRGSLIRNCTWLHQVRTAVHRAQLRDCACPRMVQCVGSRARTADVIVFIIGTYFPRFRTEWSAIIYLYFAFSHRRTDLYYFFTVAWK